MDRRVFFTVVGGGLAAAAGISAKAHASPMPAEPREMQWGGPGPYYGDGWGGPRPWRRRYGYGPGPWGPPPPWRRRCWINRWGERICRF